MCSKVSVTRTRFDYAWILFCSPDLIIVLSPEGVNATHSSHNSSKKKKRLRFTIVVHNISMNDIYAGTLWDFPVTYSRDCNGACRKRLVKQCNIISAAINSKNMVFDSKFSIYLNQACST